MSQEFWNAKENELFKKYKMRQMKAGIAQWRVLHDCPILLV